MAAVFDAKSVLLTEGTPEEDTGSWTHTIGGSVTNGYVCVWISNVNSVAEASLTVNGVAATRIVGPITNSYGEESYLFGCATGSVTGAITIALGWVPTAGNNYWSAWAESFSGANQAPTWTSGVTYQSAVGSSGGSDTVSAVMSGLTTGCLSASGIGGHYDGAISTSTGTAEYTYSDGSLIYGAAWGTTGTQTWTVAGDNSSVLLAAIITPSGPAAPADTVLPAVSGNTWQGQTLTSTTGTWTGSPTGYTYQWKNSATGNISGATSSTYVLQASDVGDTITCAVTATNAQGSTTATSLSTATITNAAPPGAGGAPGLTAPVLAASGFFGG